MEWSVEIMQWGEIVPERVGEVLLNRAPFTIRVRAFQTLSIRLNALTDDRNYRRIQPGVVVGEGGTPETDHCFASGTGLAEYSPGSEQGGEPIPVGFGVDGLILAELGHHYLYYNNEQDHRWTFVTFNSGEVIHEREVRYLTVLMESLKYLDDHHLYLVFLAKDGPGPIEEGELRKLVLTFA